MGREWDDEVAGDELTWLRQAQGNPNGSSLDEDLALGLIRKGLVLTVSRPGEEPLYVVTAEGERASQ